MGDFWFHLALAAYVIAATLAYLHAARGTPSTDAILAVIAVGTAASGISIAFRWQAVGYGPFLTLYEVLLSNAFSLGLISLLVFLRSDRARASMPFALTIMVVLCVWAATQSSAPGRLPATFDSPWLWVHVGLGKVFLGLLLVATGIACSLLLRRRTVASAQRDALDGLLWRFLAIGFLFDSGMLLAGSVWAQNAWGSYWSWDPVETWAFITWLTLGLCLHTRLTWRLPQTTGWILTICVFALAFLTLFGMPFLSLGPHKGIM